MGCCGAQQANVEYEVTFKDGTKAIASTRPEARILLAKDVTTGSSAGSMRAVTKKK